MPKKAEKCAKLEQGTQTTQKVLFPEIYCSRCGVVGLHSIHPCPHCRNPEFMLRPDSWMEKPIGETL
jgi:hypothetical protein